MTKNKREQLRDEIKKVKDYELRPMADDIASKIKEHFNSLSKEEKEKWKIKTQDINNKLGTGKQKAS